MCQIFYDLFLAQINTKNAQYFAFFRCGSPNIFAHDSHMMYLVSQNENFTERFSFLYVIILFIN